MNAFPLVEYAVQTWLDWEGPRPFISDEFDVYVEDTGIWLNMKPLKDLVTSPVTILKDDKQGELLVVNHTTASYDFAEIVCDILEQDYNDKYVLGGRYAHGVEGHVTRHFNKVGFINMSRVNLEVLL